MSWYLPDGEKRWSIECKLFPDRENSGLFSLHSMAIMHSWLIKTLLIAASAQSDCLLYICSACLLYTHWFECFRNYCVVYFFVPFLVPQQCSFPIYIYLTSIYVECCAEARAALLSALTAAPPCCCSPDTSSVPQRGSLTSRRGVRGARGEARTLLIPRGDAPSTELPCHDGRSQIKKPRFQRFH